MWEERAFEFEFSATRVFMRKTFVYNNSESVQFAFSQKNASFECKAPQMRYALESLIGDGLFISDGETWRKRRRIVAPIVHVSRLAKFAPIMVEAAEEVQDRWTKSEGTTVDVLVESATLTAEIFCRTLFGRKLGRDYARQIVDGFSEYQRVIGQTDLLSLLGLPDWIPRWYSRAIDNSVRSIQGVLSQVIESARAQAGADENSVISQLLKARDVETGESLDPEALRNEIAVLFMAGRETTANSLTWVWYLLSQAPTVEDKLHTELDSVLGGRPPSLADIPKLVYARDLLRGITSLSAGSDPAAGSRTRGILQERAHTQRLADIRGAVAAAPAQEALGQAGSFHSGTVSAGEFRLDLEIRLYPVQHRAAHLRRYVVWVDRGDPLPRDAGAKVQVAAAARLCRQSGLPADAASRGRHAMTILARTGFAHAVSNPAALTTDCPAHHG